MLKNVGKTIQSGAKQALKAESLGVVGGFAGSRVVERLAYGAFRGVFGHNSGPGSLSGRERTARIVFKAATAVLVAGVGFSARNAVARGAAVGMVGGLTWHVLNDLGINV